MAERMRTKRGPDAVAMARGPSRPVVEASRVSGSADPPASSGRSGTERGPSTSRGCRSASSRRPHPPNRLGPGQRERRTTMWSRRRAPVGSMPCARRLERCARSDGVLGVGRMAPGWLCRLAPEVMPTRSSYLCRLLLGAGDENRTRVLSLGSRNRAIAAATEFPDQKGLVEPDVRNLDSAGNPWAIGRSDSAAQSHRTNCASSQRLRSCSTRAVWVSIPAPWECSQNVQGCFSASRFAGRTELNVHQRPPKSSHV